MWSTPKIDTAASMEGLFFEIPEANASPNMAATFSSCCRDLAIPFTTVDVWADPGAVLAHRILAGPTIILFADGVEVGRLIGPSSCRRVKRFFAKATTTPNRTPALEAA